ncbi:MULTISPECIES: hypothetical protein [unclassified Tenacibaculum]|uniref:hypothetical protein n=1 Tax=unclassified Tenacibaculum TaxID=2635139 RepID=UPI001F41B4AB|nr:MULTISPECIES: hypothetical protein [unclassified Tenacibaculum]MCF2874305.1 hypothetical protein [Tenacibaculum sp. Cn5-1]MCF2934886.1 hypothetical protein [Tenacibaculum sp. Cn5-34]MCG7511096.1 hypothetical protein [Tenacibaculum sp. Cn5-46]
MILKLFKHPLFIAVFSGLILAFIGNHLEKNREKIEREFQIQNLSNEKKLLKVKSKITQYEKYIEELASGTANFYNSVENYILDLNEYHKNRTLLNEERVWKDIQNVNYSRTPIFAVFEKLLVTDIGKKMEKEIRQYYLLIIEIAKLTQTRRFDKKNVIRKLLDEKFTTKQTWFLYKIQTEINNLTSY